MSSGQEDAASGLILSSRATSAVLERMRTEQQQMQTAISALELRLADLETKRPDIVKGLNEVQQDVLGLKASCQHSQPWAAKQDLAELVGCGSELGPAQPYRIDEGQEFNQGPHRGREFKQGPDGGSAKPSTASLFSFQSLSFLAGRPSEYAIEESMWELVLFIGLRDVMNTWDSVLMVLCFCANVAMQFFVCIILQEDAFLEYPFPEKFLSDLRAWRLTDAHSDRFANPVYAASLASRVCNEDRALTLSTFQQNLYLTIEDYTSSKGDWLALVAIIVWTCCCVAELRKCIVFLCALLNVPKSWATEILWDGQEWCMKSIMHCRVLLGVLVFLARIAIAVLLLTSGCKWLAFTESIEELLLNASALGFVIEVDEIIYAAFVPLRWEEMLRNFKPLERSAHDVLGHWTPQLLFITSSVMISLATVLWLEPLVEVMGIAQGIMCDGEKDFVYGVDAFSRVKWIKTFEPGVLSPHNKAQRQIVHGLVYSEFDFTEQVSIQERSPRVFNLDMRLTQGEFAEQLPTCADNLVSTEVHLGMRLWSVSGNDQFYNASLTTCQDLAEAFPRLCEEKGDGDKTTVGNYMRFHCPGSCGCADVSSGLSILGTEYFGCPLTACRRELQASIASKSRHLKCKDRPAMELRADAGWQRFARVVPSVLYSTIQGEVIRQSVIEDFESALSKSGFRGELTEDKLSAMMTTRGCSFVALAQSNLSQEAGDMLCNAFIHGASIFCPETCGCKREGRGIAMAGARCPASCFPRPG